MKFTKVHRITKFKKDYFIKDSIETITKLRTEAKPEAQKRYI